MFCGSAAGEMLPPMVVYKAIKSYNSWKERGPKGAVSSSTKSSWFDGYQYKKWFFDTYLSTKRPEEEGEEAAGV